MERQRMSDADRERYLSKITDYCSYGFYCIFDNGW